MWAVGCLLTLLALAWGDNQLGFHMVRFVRFEFIHLLVLVSRCTYRLFTHCPRALFFSFPLQQHANDMRAWPQLLLKGFRSFTVDIYFLLPSECARLSVVRSMDLPVVWCCFCFGYCAFSPRIPPLIFVAKYPLCAVLHTACGRAGRLFCIEPRRADRDPYVCDSARPGDFVEFKHGCVQTIAELTDACVSTVFSKCTCGGVPSLHQPAPCRLAYRVARCIQSPAANTDTIPFGHCSTPTQQQSAHAGSCLCARGDGRKKLSVHFAFSYHPIFIDFVVVCVLVPCDFSIRW
jgi:hypothetical protein